MFRNPGTCRSHRQYSSAKPNLQVLGTEFRYNNSRNNENPVIASAAIAFLRGIGEKMIALFLVEANHACRSRDVFFFNSQLHWRQRAKQKIN